MQAQRAQGRRSVWPLGHGGPAKGRRTVRLARLSPRCAASPPGSREEAISQARGALAAGLGGMGQRRDFEKGVLKQVARSQKRLLIEFPLVDDRPDTLASLVADLTQGVASTSQFVFASQSFGQSAAAAGCAPCKVIGERISKKTKAVHLVLAGLERSQFAAAEQLIGLKKWSAVVLINPSADFPGADQDRFLASFDTVYHFLPLLVSGFFGVKVEGALMSCRGGGAQGEGEEEGKPWGIFLKEGNSFSQISAQASKPDQEEIELALYNNIASTNPLIKGAKSLKGFLGGNK